MAKNRSIASEANTTWRNRAELSIAHGALTNSKRPQCFVDGVYPSHLKSGQGCTVIDVDGKRYIDFICGLGSNILGYGNAEIAEAIYSRARLGATLSLGTHLEVELAELLKGVFPFVDQFRFLKSGTDACNAAIRIARTKTRRHKILSEGYHGWGDEFVSLTPPALGVSGAYPIEKLETLDQIDDEVAAVIIEPVQLDASDARREDLHRIRAKCSETGALLIFDEVITGFRFPKMGVSMHFGVTPDLLCIGKAMGNGMPISAVGGKREIMESGQYFISSTFAGETLSIAAALKTVTLLSTKYSLDWLWANGQRFLDQFNGLHPEIKIKGYPTRGVFEAPLELKALFWQESCRAGILFGPSWFFNFEHILQADLVLNTASDIMTRIKTGAVKLQGELPTTPFAAQVRKQ